MTEYKQEKRSKKRKMSRNDVIFHVVTYTVFVILTLVCFFPFYYLIVCTISDNHLVELGKITFVPVNLHFDNYVTIFKLDNLLNSTVITLGRTIISLFVNLLTTSYMAYFFTKKIMWKRKFWYRIVIATMYFSAGIIPIYLNIRMLGLLNSFLVYIIPGMLSVYNMVLVKTYIESLPESLEESAQIDGAGYLKRFVKIVLPLSKPILATIGLFIIVAEWNDFFTTKLYVTNPKLYTIQYMLYEYIQQLNAVKSMLDSSSVDDALLATQANTTSIRLTMTAVVTIPIMCVYPFIQKFYVKGIMLGSVKG